MVTFRETGKEFEMKGVLLKMITKKKYIVDLASLSHEKIWYDFAKETYFDVKTQGYESNRDKTLIKLPKFSSLMICAYGTSNTIFLPSDLNELCNRLKL